MKSPVDAVLQENAAEDLGYQLTSAVSAGLLKWSDVSRATSMSIGELASMLRGYPVEPDSREIIEAILRDCNR